MTGPEGKLDPETMERVVYANLGANSKRILKGPRRGLDNAVISLGDRRVMLLTTDPISMIPSLGARKSSWLSVHLIASDYVTSGRSPEFATFDFNFPSEMSATDRELYLKGIGSTCKNLGVAIVAGHTGSYPGADYTVIGGGIMFGFSRKGGYIDPSMSRPGDDVIMTKGVAIEATASLASSFPKLTAERIGGRLTKKAMSLLGSCSVVKDALAAANVGVGRGGITSMHDATEGGVLGGLDEMAGASHNAIVVDQESVIIPPEVEAVCSAFGINPLTSLSEGTLLATCNPRKVGELLVALEKEGIEAAAIGKVRKGDGLWLHRKGKPPVKARSTTDGYWGAYARASSRGWGRGR